MISGVCIFPDKKSKNSSFLDILNIMTDIKEPVQSAVDEKATLLHHEEQDGQKVGNVVMDIQPSPVEIVIERNLAQIANQKADPRLASLTRQPASANLNAMSQWLFNSVS